MSSINITDFSDTQSRC